MYSIYCKLRDELGLKDSDISKATGITKSTFSDWKSGRSKPKNDKLQKIADYFNVTIDYLMTGSEKDHIPTNNSMYAIDKSEQRLLMLCRKAEDDPAAKEAIVKHFEATVDMYLQAKGINKE